MEEPAETLEETFKALEETQHEYWNISRQTAVFISMLIKLSGTKTALEIGTSNGYSTLWIAQALSQTNGHLTTIEFWDKRQKIAVENLEKHGLLDYVTPVTGRALTVLKELNIKPDFVFIDANKAEYVQYFDTIKGKMPKGAVLLADNVLSHKEKVKPFVDKITADTDFQCTILDLPAGLLMAYKLH